MFRCSCRKTSITYVIVASLGVHLREPVEGLAPRDLKMTRRAFLSGRYALARVCYSAVLGNFIAVVTHNWNSQLVISLRVTEIQEIYCSIRVEK